MDSTQDRTTPAHLADLVTAAAGRHPDHPALVEDPSTSTTSGPGSAPGASTLSWGDFDAAGSAEATRLAAAGVAAGDRVAVRGGGAALAVAVLGALRAGAVVVPLGPSDAGAAGAGEATDAVLADCTPRVLVDCAGDTGDDTGGDTAGDTAAAAGRGERGAVAVLGPPDLHARAEARPAVGGGADLALLLYTSGSPRGVCLSHRALLANRDQAGALRPAPITPVDRVLLAQPLFHALGLAAGLFQIWWAGATAVLPGPGRPDARWLVDAVGRHRASGLAAGPWTYRALLDLPAERLRAGLAGLRLCTCGGAPLPVTWADAFRAATGLRIVEGYGLTEAGPVVTSTPIDGVARAGSVGRPLPGVELRLVDRAGRPLGSDTGAAAGSRTGSVTEGPAVDRADRVAQVRAAAGRAASEVRAAAPRGVAQVRAAAGRAATEVRAAVRAAAPVPGVPVGDPLDDAHDVEGPVDPMGDTGLIAVRGPNLFSGYWPDRSGGPDADGWFVTPDLGFVDASGELHLVDRSTDLVVVNGFTVYPHEVERVLTELDGVVEAAVVGVPDARAGQAVRAVVVRAGGAGPEGSGTAQVTADAVRAHCRARLARFKEPTQVVFVDALPRTPAGRLVRRRLLGTTEP